MKAVSAIFRPGQAMRKLMGSPRPFRRSASLVAGVGVLYGVSSAILAVAGAVPTAPVFFGLDADNYYFWQMVFVAPLILAAWMLASGALFSPGKANSGGPGFRGTSAAAAIALSTLLFVVWVPTAVYALFMTLGMSQEEWVSILSAPGPWQTVYIVWYAAASIRAVHDFILAARLIHKRSWPAAILTGIAASAVAMGAYVAFIR